MPDKFTDVSRGLARASFTVGRNSLSDERRVEVGLTRGTWRLELINDIPKQMFRSSLPIGRVLEDLYDPPPMILCYKRNGQWLSLKRRGPVRVVVPEAYGLKSIKWLSHVVLTNLAYANETYIGQS